MSKLKQLSSPSSTGGAGNDFERHVQAAYAVLMLSGGFAPALTTKWPIYKIKLQGKHNDFNTDDLIIFTKDPVSSKEARLLGQIKLSLNLTQDDSLFGDVINSMWHDFINPSVFTKGVDALALITGPISKVDTENVRTILEWSRASNDSSDFLDRVNKTRFSSKKKIEKLSAFKVQLSKAKGNQITDEELWQILKSFHLIGYDFDVEHGVVRSLLETIIGMNASRNASGIWTQIVDKIGYADQYAAVLMKESFSSEIIDAFTKKEVITIPEALVEKIEQEVKAGVEERIFTSEIAQVFLIGSWDEKLDDDKKTIEKAVDSPYRKWIKSIQMIASQSNSIIEQKNQIWKFRKRIEQWKTYAPLLYDDHLDRFKEIAIAVLSEKDPKFELPKDKRYAASIYGKNRIFSKSLVHGITEGVTLIGVYSDDLTSCSTNKAEVIAALLVREVLASNDWVVWTSLNDYLPLLAEASPNEFLDAIEQKLNDKDNTLFQSVFTQEGGGMLVGRNYITGVLWGLETLAWCPKYLPRVTIILGQLAEIDPGGYWANRPMNSLTTIYLPWLPQTMADIEIRKVAIDFLLRECPSVGWKLLLSLLPNARQSSNGCRKPTYRGFISKEYLDQYARGQNKISNVDYFNQVEYYSDRAVENAKNNFERLKELVGKIDSLPNNARSKLMDYLKSPVILKLADEQKVDIWEKLMDVVVKHQRFSDANWAMPSTLVNKILDIADLLTPLSLILKYRRLFGQHELYTKKDNYEEQEKEIANLRTNALKEILATSGTPAILDFAHFARYPAEVGQALGRVDNIDLDQILLPDKLIDPDKVVVEVVRGYVWSMFHLSGWEWFDNLDKTKWTDAQKVLILIFLPFIKETWKRANSLLGVNEELYWKGADAKPYQLKEDLSEAVEQLIKFNRPKAAIRCLNWLLFEKIEISLDHIYSALILNPSSNEGEYDIDQHDIVELIKWLQSNPKSDSEILSKIEWIYLRLLDHHFDQAPVTLELKLANDPKFFCEAIQIVYKSDKPENNPEEVNEERKQLATHVYRLLFQWQVPPGTLQDGSFDEVSLKNWIEEVELSCEKSGHLKIAHDHIGKVFAHHPQDPSGLWIHKAIADVLNGRDAEIMRKAFNVEKYNMRGVFWDSQGQEEKNLANNYREKADAVEKESYIRLAVSLRGLADSYDRDSEREANSDLSED